MRNLTLVHKPLLFVLVFALICLLIILVFMAPVTGEEQIASNMTLYNHDYRIRLSPQNLSVRTDGAQLSRYSITLSNLFTPKFTQKLYEEMSVDDSLREAYTGLHMAYIQVAKHYIGASSLPNEYHDPFIAFVTAGKAVESSGNSKPKNVIPLVISASDYAANPDILMQFSSGNLMGLPPNAYAPEDGNGDSGPLCIGYEFLGYPIIPEELGVIGSPAGTRHDKDRSSLVGDRWNLYDSFNCIVGYLKADINGKMGMIPDMYKENFYTRFCMFAYWHNAGASCVYSQSDKELAAEVAHILGSDEMIAYARDLIMEQVNAGNGDKMRGFLYGTGGNDQIIAGPVWEKMYSMASPTLQAKIDVNAIKDKINVNRVNNAGRYTTRALTGWLMIEMTFAGLY